MPGFDKKGKAENGHATERPKCLLNDHSIETRQRVEFQYRQEAYQKKNKEIGPFAVSDATDDDGCSEEGCDDSLGKVTVIL